MCLLAEAESSCSRLHGCLCSSAPVLSPILPPQGWYRRPSTHSGHSPFQGAKWAPILTQILPKLLFSFQRSAKSHARLHRCSLGEDDSLSSGGLSSSCVALRLSAGGFPRGPWLQLHPQQHSGCCAADRTAQIQRRDINSNMCYSRHVSGLWSEWMIGCPLQASVNTPPTHVCSARRCEHRGKTWEIKDLKKKMAVKWFKSWLVGDLTEQRH